ncbi:unnamed protein product [Tilletia controversa]|nr:hypothetical protein CF328_g4841 [Tilletia controversa]CAD6908445.1 unnamed protein product [Tilletia controversa]
MAASSSSSSASSFGRLLQSTRISTWDPTIPQLYTAPAAFAARGQYGFKRPVPVPQQRNRQEQDTRTGASASSSGPGSLSSIARQRNIDLVCPDTPAGIAVWATDSIHPRFLRTFEEKAVKLRDYDVLSRRDAKDRVIENPTTEPSSVFDSTSRRVLPSEVASYPASTADALDLAQSGLARPNGLTSVRRAPSLPSYSYSGTPLNAQAAPSASTYTSLDIVPNYARMSEKQFEAYLHQIRTKVRPALIQHLAGLDRRTASSPSSRATAKAAVQARAAEDRKLALMAEKAKASGVDVETADAHAEIAAGRASDSIPVPPQQQSTADDVIVDMWDASRAMSSSYTTTFVRARFAKEAVQPRSSTLPSSSGRLIPNGDLPPLHPNGGLQYGGPDEIYTSRLGRPAGLPAHVLHRVADAGSAPRGVRRSIFSSSSFARGGAAVSLGGHVAHIPGPVMPRQVTPLDSVYGAAETAASAGGVVSEDEYSGESAKFPSQLLVRPFGAYHTPYSSADRARFISQDAPSALTGVSPTASLAALAAGRPIGSAREHVVLPDPTTIHVRVRPVYMDEVFANDNRPLSLDRESSTPGTPTYIATEAEPLSVASNLPGLVRNSNRVINNPNWDFANSPRRITPGMASDSMRPRPSGQFNSMFSELSNVGSSVSRGARRTGGEGSEAAAADGEGEDGGDGSRLRRTSVGPAAKRKHQSNIKK